MNYLKTLIVTMLLASGCAIVVPAAPLPTDANGQLLIRTDGEIASIASFVLYRTSAGVLYAFSAGHCVESNATYIGIWQDHPVSMTPVYVDTNHDISVFSVADQTLQPPVMTAVEIATNKDAAVTTVGSCHRRWCPVLVNGAYRQTAEGYAIYDMPGITQGYSGAGVFDAAGRLVGLVVIRIEETGYAGIVPMSTVNDALRTDDRVELLPRVTN